MAHVVNESTNLASIPETGRATAKAAPADSSNGESSNSPIGQAIALRATLAQINELIRSLKREKRESRLVASALASLKQLQKAA